MQAPLAACHHPTSSEHDRQSQVLATGSINEPMNQGQGTHGGTAGDKAEVKTTAYVPGVHTGVGKSAGHPFSTAQAGI